MREYKIGDRVEVTKVIRFMMFNPTVVTEHDFVGLQGTIVGIDLNDDQNHKVKLDNLPEIYTDPKYAEGIWFEEDDTITLKEAI